MNQTTEKEKPKRWKLVLLGLLMILLAGMTVANIQRGLTSQIYLYGEEHSQQRILDEELEIWGGYYAGGNAGPVCGVSLLRCAVFKPLDESG